MLTAFFILLTENTALITENCKVTQDAVYTRTTLTCLGLMGFETIVYIVIILKFKSQRKTIAGLKDTVDELNGNVGKNQPIEDPYYSQLTPPNESSKDDDNSTCGYVDMSGVPNNTYDVPGTDFKTTPL